MIDENITSKDLIQTIEKNCKKSRATVSCKGST